ncbi:prohibitin family protein [Oceanibaculum pacificum]|uniref:Band 7 domain-containing protein n=1 Tax=Oceanibaculum pacificum TaxID=580166 RepID=A0A154W3G2_9PROT|nr:prohibitin family protein [Oceanibaculum pacificum]KZD07951.1 hypothetical protein AUP43_09150 [Oceanibaculum pacificum]
MVAQDSVEEDEAPRRDLFRRYDVYVLGFLIVLVILAALLWPLMVVTIRSGEAGVQFRWFSGTERAEVYQEGTHLILPWNTMYIYDVRLRTEERQYKLLTDTGLPVDLRVAVRYRPDVRMLPLLHVAVGPDYVNRVIFPETEAVLRREVGRYSPEEVYTSARGLLEKILISTLAQTEDRFVLIDEVLIKSVELPEQVREAIERKLVLSEQEKSYVYRLSIETKEAERKRIEAVGIRDYQKTISETLTDDLLRWQGIQATKDLAASPNAKTVVIGGGGDGLPVILGGADR